MKKTDTIVKVLKEDIEKKDVLEVACGAADFSVSALLSAKSVSCIDLDDTRLTPQAKQSDIHFQVMDAGNMTYADCSFDTIVIYNAFFHIQTQWEQIEKECKRVLKSTGSIIIVGTWKLDTSLMIDFFGDRAICKDDFLVVRILNRQNGLTDHNAPE